MDFEIWWLLAFTVVMTVLVGVYKLAFAFINRHSSHALPTDLERRLARIEHAVESTAIEVERIEESQRFLTRTLTERLASKSASESSLAGRVITPH
jgi:hypothetical protein